MVLVIKFTNRLLLLTSLCIVVFTYFTVYFYYKLARSRYPLTSHEELSARIIKMKKKVLAIGHDEEVLLSIQAFQQSKKKFESKMKEMNQSSYSPVKENRNGFLCSVFLKLTNSSLETLNNNMMHTSHYNFCDWIVIAYAGNEKMLEEVQNSAIKLNINLIHCSMLQYSNLKHVINKFWSNIIDNIGKQTLHIYPKPLIYIELIPYLKKYEYVWLLDDDISLQEINLQYINARLFSKNSNIKHMQPLISQLTVTDNSITEKFYKFLNSKNWRINHNSIDIIPTSFIEMQSPILESNFLEWFLDVVIIPMSAPMAILESDFGLDNIWCGAANFYSEKLRNNHKNNIYNGNNNFIERYSGNFSRNSEDLNGNIKNLNTKHLIPCGLIVTNQSIIHLDFKSSKRFGKHIRRVAFSHNENLILMFAELFNNWFILGDSEINISNDILELENTKNKTNRAIYLFRKKYIRNNKHKKNIF